MVHVDGGRLIKGVELCKLYREFSRLKMTLIDDVVNITT